MRIINDTLRSLLTRHLLAGLLLMTSLHAIGGSTNNIEKLNRHNTDLAKTQQQIQQAQTQLAKFSKSQNSLQNKVREQELQVSNINREIRHTGQLIQTNQRELARLKKSSQQLNQKKQSQQQALIKDVQSSYAMGRQEYVKLMLNQEQPQKLARLMRYYDYYQRARGERIAAFKNNLQKIYDHQQSINQKNLLLQQQRDNLESQQQKLTLAITERNTLLGRVRHQVKAEASNIAQLEKNQQHLSALISSMEELLQDLPISLSGKSFKSQKGKLRWPTKGGLTSKYRSKRADGRLRSNGIVIRNKVGSEVKAVYSGHVVFADWLRGFGLLTMIDHGNGYLSLYGHNYALLREPGDWVQAGEIISTVGDSDVPGKGGLYFEIRKNGKPTNPIKWLQKS